MGGVRQKGKRRGEEMRGTLEGREGVERMREKGEGSGEGDGRGDEGRKWEG